MPFPIFTLHHFSHKKYLFLQRGFRILAAIPKIVTIDSVNGLPDASVPMILKKFGIIFGSEKHIRG
jgi:hypothetical protein